MTDQLRAACKGAGVQMTNAQLRALVAELGAEAAEWHILSVGALITLASAMYGVDLPQAGAVRRLEEAKGDFDKAAERMGRQLERRDERSRNAAFHRLERRHFAAEARQRHTLFVIRTREGSLGHQARLLIAAAADAGLKDPGPEEYRLSLHNAITAELDRRYPERHRIVAAAQGSAGLARIRQVERDEKAARQMVLDQLPTLEQRLDRLRSHKLAHDVAEVLDDVRARLARKIIQGWLPDPDRYERDVTSLIFDEARNPADDEAARAS